MLLTVYMFGERVFAVAGEKEKLQWNLDESRVVGKSRHCGRLWIKFTFGLALSLCDGLFYFIIGTVHGEQPLRQAFPSTSFIRASLFSNVLLPFSRIVKVFFSPRENRRKVLADIITWISINWPVKFFLLIFRGNLAAKF